MSNFHSELAYYRYSNVFFSADFHVLSHKDDSDPPESESALTMQIPYPAVKNSQKRSNNKLNICYTHFYLVLFHLTSKEKRKKTFADYVFTFKVLRTLDPGPEPWAA